MGVLERELILDGISNPSLRDMKVWLERNGFSTETTAISKLRKQTACDTRLSYKLESIVQTIVDNCKFVSCVSYFEDLCYRSFRFFIPEGNPARGVRLSSFPEGVYQGLRYSFSNPGHVIRSAFLFYRNPVEFEPISGFADQFKSGSIPRKSNVLRFKEVRIITSDIKPKYQLLIGGFVFYNNGCFYLTGCSMETAPGIDERFLRATDIRRMHLAFYVLDDDGDIETIRGVKVTGLRHAHEPAAAILHLEKIDDTGINITNWNKIYDSPNIHIDVLNNNDTSLQANKNFENLLNPSISCKYRMLRVRRWVD